MTKETFLQILGYETFYRRSRKSLAETDVQSFVISARTPEKPGFESPQYLLSEKKGVYRNDLGCLSAFRLQQFNELVAGAAQRACRFASRKKEKWLFRRTEMPGIRNNK
ncbi:MAG: hypothetical protein R2941_04475 [Desulfobacterales bacterium]